MEKSIRCGIKNKFILLQLHNLYTNINDYFLYYINMKCKNRIPCPTGQFSTHYQVLLICLMHITCCIIYKNIYEHRRLPSPLFLLCAFSGGWCNVALAGVTVETVYGCVIVMQQRVASAETWWAWLIQGSPVWCVRLPVLHASLNESAHPCPHILMEFWEDLVVALCGAQCIITKLSEALPFIGSSCRVPANF